jgi:23S rRNA pseudouridine1911/1915/1917 synthase
LEAATVQRLIVTAAEAGLRLDKLLAKLCPELGLRGRRRLIAEGRVRVHGQLQPAGYKVRGGEEVEILAGQSETSPPADVRIAARTEDFAALVKPPGLDSVALAGKDGPSLEAMLPQLFPDTEAVLVNRLDAATSGLVVVALNADAAQRFRELESVGQVRKTYLLVAHGHIAAGFTVKQALDTSGRKRVRALAKENPNPLRWTEVEPLKFDAEKNLTLARAVIAKGARHQIRVHLAAAGHPLLGDALYGEEDGASRLHLHAAEVAFQGFEARDEPDF